MFGMRKKRTIAVAAAVLLAPALMGLSVKMEDAPRYGIAAAGNVVVYRVDTSTGEICRFVGTELHECFGTVDDNP
jgi:hypothetical protein